MRIVKTVVLPAIAALALGAASSVAVHAEDAKPAASADLANQLDPNAEKDDKVLAVTAAAKNEGGKYLTAEGQPTFHVTNNGKKVDWYLYAGFRRYHAECHVCHGPEAMGSTYAPALKDSLKRLSYEEFVGIVAGGKESKSAGQESVMPAFGDNKNVMCYVDDLYVYLKARAAGAMGRGRPAEREDKPEVYVKAEKECLGG